MNNLLKELNEKAMALSASCAQAKSVDEVVDAAIELKRLADAVVGFCYERRR